MKMYLRRFAIRTLIPIVWRVSKDRAPATLQRFATTEADSAWQFLNALQADVDDELRNELFNNALEEVHHASEFERMSVECATSLVHKSKPERTALWDPRKPFAHFLAYVYVGESDVYQQFSAYSSAIKEAMTGQKNRRTFFDEAKEDEDGHLTLAKRALFKEFGSRRLAEREILKIRIRRAYQTWLRTSKKIGEFSTTLILGLIYFLAGPIFFLPCRRRLNYGLAKPQTGTATDYQIEKVETAISPSERH